MPVQIMKSFAVLAILAIGSSCGGGSAERTKTGGTAPLADPASAQTPEPGISIPEGPTVIITVNFDGNNYKIFKYEAVITESGASSIEGASPKVNIDFAGAKAACEKSGYRLCTKKEWQTACKGPSNNLYSIAATKDGPPAVADTCDIARTENNTPGSLPSNAGTFSKCETAGLFVSDMIGNASEWIDDNGTGVAMGVAFYQTAEDSHCDASLNNPGSTEPMPPDTVSSDVGFRCCKTE